jgi:hypothetical protein
MDEKRLRKLSGLTESKEETLEEAKGELHAERNLITILSPEADQLANMLGIKNDPDNPQRVGKAYVNYNSGDRIQFGRAARDVVSESVEEPLDEAVATWRNPGKGPDITVSISDFADSAVMEVSFSSGKILSSTPMINTSGDRAKDRKEQEKVTNQKIKEVTKLLQKFEKEVEGVLKK